MVSGLLLAGMSGEFSFEGLVGGGEIAGFELGEAEIHLKAGDFRVEREGL
jgi:hypothetical protein